VKKFLPALTGALSLLVLTAASAALPPAPAPAASGAVGRALAALPTPASRQTVAVSDLFVSPNGVDSNPGTELQPFRTIDRAAKAAQAGTTVHVMPGSYRGTVQTAQSGMPKARVRFESTVRWGARLLGNGKDAVWTNQGDYVDIAGFDVSGTGRIGILNLGSHTLIEDNHVHHLGVIGGCTPNGGAGIDNGNYAGSDGDIIGNVVHDIGVPGACNGVHGIYSSNLGGHIVNNLVFRAASFGIHLWHAATRVTIANNTVFANGSANMGGGIVLGNGDSPGGAVLNHTQVINNIVYDNPAVSIKEFCYPGHDCTGRSNVFANNLVFANGAPITLRRGRPLNTIEADPQFVNYRPDGSGVYRLGPTSPALARGVRVPGMNTSRNGSGDTPAIGHVKEVINIGANIDFVQGAATTPLARK
jgi:Right handed beta helix region/Protein of unknown function (DUF1565)